MRIGFLILNLNVRGSVRRVVELSNGLIRRGHEAIVYTEAGEPCEWLPMLAGVECLEGIAGEFDAVLQLGGPRLTHYMVRADARRKLRYLLGLDPAEIDALAGAIRGTQPAPDIAMAEKAAAIREGRTIANCTAISRWVLLVSGQLCPLVPGGVDRNTFRPGLGDRRPLAILAAGGRQGADGTGDVLAMFDVVKAAMPEVRLEMYAYRGYGQAELAQLYGTATVFVDAHLAAGWNNPVAEAMACGTAVVCTDVWGNEDFATDDETALVVPPRDVAGLAAATLRLLGDDELRARLAANALQVISRFTWEAATDALEEVLRCES